MAFAMTRGEAYTIRSCGYNKSKKGIRQEEVYARTKRYVSTKFVTETKITARAADWMRTLVEVEPPNSDDQGQNFQAPGAFSFEFCFGCAFRVAGCW